MLLGSLDMRVDEHLCLEPLVTTEYILHYIRPKMSSLQRQTFRMDRGMDARPCGPSRAASACLGGHKKIRSLDECRQSVAAQQNASMRHEP